MIGLDASLTGLDTNVLARYVVRDDPAQYEAAAAVIATLTPDSPGLITHVSLAELSWTLARTYKMSKEARLAIVRALIQADEIEFEDGEGVVRALALAEDGADFADALIATTMELFGADRVVTFDKAAAKHLGWELLV
ncbi:type II toxin-antitoxin system VapC family toxin [Microbacterium sp. KR10-403]|uniref:PIN domain-containing protein n=1 Tax=Microbacterium sp. KR10-403 TaxID=3158581 RepID=UPI0032E4FEF0